jgi:hypothetical protein
LWLVSSGIRPQICQTVDEPAIVVLGRDIKAPSGNLLMFLNQWYLAVDRLGILDTKGKNK